LIKIFIAKCQIKYYHTLSENADNNHKCFCDVFLFVNISVSHFILHTITYVFSIFIITNKCTINITKVHNTIVSFYIICIYSNMFQHSMSSSGSPIAVPCWVEYIHYVHDIISIHPYNKVHIYCRLYMRPQIHTVCTRI
jgi:hypothetical protein